MVMFFPLSRLRRQLSQRESCRRVMHYTERCIEVRPCYLFDKLEVVLLLVIEVDDKSTHYCNSNEQSKLNPIT